MRVVFFSRLEALHWRRVAHHTATHFAGPYVTSVGGTTSHTPEEAADISGGGFSNYFERQPYQEQVVATFLQGLGNRYQGLYKCVPFRDPI